MSAYNADAIDERKKPAVKRADGREKRLIVVLVEGHCGIKVKGGLVVQRNPPEFFDLMGEVFAVEEMNHPVAALVAALQQEELTPLLVVQLNDVKRGCGGTEISETNG